MAATVRRSRFDPEERSDLSPDQRATLLTYSQRGDREITERRAWFAGVARFIGLDIHKQYVVVVGVDRELNQVLGPTRLTWERWPAWVDKNLTPQDAVAVEMTTNTWEVHDDLVDHVHSVTVAHPPHLKLITAMPVMNDKRSSQALASLLACGLLRPVWVPDEQTRAWRSLIAARRDRVGAATQAKNRLHAILHRHQLKAPETSTLFLDTQRDWWLSLAVTPVEKLQVRLDLAALDLYREQIKSIEEVIYREIGADARLPFLVQFPGIGLVGALTILGAIGTIQRFAKARHLVGYAGLGARVHDSGNTRTTGGLTKTGRKDLRTTLINAAQVAVRSHAHWESELNRLAPRIGRNKAIVAIARKLLVAVWHVLMKEEADRHANVTQVARAFADAVYSDIHAANLPEGETGPDFVRRNLDALKIGKDLQSIQRGGRLFTLPRSRQLEAASIPETMDAEVLKNGPGSRTVRSGPPGCDGTELGIGSTVADTRPQRPRRERIDKGVKREPDQAQRKRLIRDAEPAMK